MSTQIARVAPTFLEHIKSIGLADEATARAIGIAADDYRAIKSGAQQPSVAFMAGAVHAGLAASFSDVAEVVPAKVSA